MFLVPDLFEKKEAVLHLLRESINEIKSDLPPELPEPPSFEAVELSVWRKEVDSWSLIDTLRPEGVYAFHGVHIWMDIAGTLLLSGGQNALILVQEADGTEQEYVLNGGSQQIQNGSIVVVQAAGELICLRPE